MLLDTITRNEEQLINTVNYLVNYIGQDKIINIFNLKSRKHDIKRKSNDLLEIITLPDMESLSINFSKNTKTKHIGIYNLENGSFRFILGEMFMNTFQLKDNILLSEVLPFSYLAYDNTTHKLANLYYKAQNYKHSKYGNDPIFDKYDYFNALGHYIEPFVSFYSTWFYYFECTPYSYVPDLINYRSIKTDTGFYLEFNGPEKNIQLEDVIAWLEDYEKLLNLSVLYYRKIGIEVDL